MSFDSMSIRSMVDAMRSKQVSCEEVVTGYLNRIEAREEAVGAWAHIDPELALRYARQRDREGVRGVLHGIPIGIKDIFETFDQPTEFGSALYRGARSHGDSACASLIREAGGIVIGKTVTTEFALSHPHKTRNPFDLGRTPGGSSSGSAAAVSDGMAPLAIGSQTVGSLIRPASYCGVVGYKPSYNAINRAGMKPLAESLDTVGICARTVGDAALLASVLTGDPCAELEETLDFVPRIGFCKTFLWEHAEAALKDGLDEATNELRRAGAEVTEVELPEPYASLPAAEGVIVDFESWRSLAFERTSLAHLLSGPLSARLREAGLRTFHEYQAAQNLAEKCRQSFDEVLADHDVLLTPSAPGEAPEGLDSIGPMTFNRMWTTLHVPCITVPALNGPSGLPMGVQLVGCRGSDHKVLRIAAWVHRVLASTVSI